MKVAIVTGSGGLIGSETCKELDHQGFTVDGIDNDMRSYFFGEDASTKPNSAKLTERLDHFIAREADIRDELLENIIFAEFGRRDLDLFNQ